jgi:hypothetical protein
VEKGVYEKGWREGSVRGVKEGVYERGKKEDV